MIPYSTQSIDESDISAVEEVLRSPYLTTGPAVGKFENCVCEYTGARYGVALSSCTSALHLAVKALGIGDGDLVYVSAISFASSANCARMCGADVEFVDVDPLTGNMDMEALEQKLAEANTAGRLPKAVICVHLSGRSAQIEKLYALKLRYGFFVVEDAAHALGAVYLGERCGSGKYSDVTVLSFHPVKIITTAEGGMCLCNDEGLAREIRLLSCHGIVHDKALLHEQQHPAYYYEMQQLGYNYRMSDIQAALGISQMHRIDSFLEKRRALAADYPNQLEGCPLLTLPQADSAASVSSWHLYQVHIGGGFRDQIYEILRKKSIGVQVHYLPIYRHPYYQNLRPYSPLPGAEAFFASTLTMPLFPTLTRRDQSYAAVQLLSELDKISSK